MRTHVKLIEMDKDLQQHELSQDEAGNFELVMDMEEEKSTPPPIDG